MGNTLVYLLTGGFLKGYRTYILTSVAIITVVGSWAVGDMDTSHAVTAVSLALGLNTAANHGE